MTHPTLAKEVTEKLNEGWELAGGPFVDDFGIHQALLKRERASAEMHVVKLTR